MAEVVQDYAVIPGYFLVWYDPDDLRPVRTAAVIPGYFLVWYDGIQKAP